MPVYLDNNATTPVDAEVLDAMLPYFGGPYANASSLHRYGRAARDAVDRARSQVAALVGARAEQVVFTSGGTESNNLAIRGIAERGAPGAVLYGATEHSAVLEPMQALAQRGWQVETIPADAQGQLDLPWAEHRLGDGDVRLISAMRANNETGVISDVTPLFAAARAAGVTTHCDAVQAAGKIALDVTELGADLVSLSAHKIYGPKGVGALIVLGDTDLLPQIVGGGQEDGLRGGTENVAAIVGFGAAAAAAKAKLAERAEHVRGLRDPLQMQLQAMPGVQIFAADAQRLPNTLQFAMAGFDGEALLMALDQMAGIAVSSGSACDSGKGEPSHVLLGMGLDADTAKGAVRVSFGKHNTDDDVQALLAALSQLNPVNSRLMRSVAQ